MKFTQTENTFVINIEKGEELISTLTSFCTEHKIVNAHFHGIGAAQGLSCGYYALEEKKYYFTEYDDLVEAVSLSGNILQKEGKPFVHMHGVFTDRDNNAFGGHVEKVVSGIVLEVILQVLPSSIEREHNAEIGLFLMSCGK
jgi:predicted DNA-binding protein with PD1-like motif